MNIFQTVVPALCMALLAGCASLKTQTAVPAPVLLAMQEVGIAQSSLGVVAFALDGSAPGWSFNALQSMQPGSTMKVVTTAVALEQLGANARSRTDLLATVPLQGDVLAGSLYLRGGADSDLDWGALWNMLRQLRERGVRHIQGGLVVDRTMFLPARLDIGAAPFDESPEFQYNVIPDALYLQGNMLGFQLKSDAAALVATTHPALPGLRIDTSGMALVDRACTAWEDGWKLPVVAMDSGRPIVRLGGEFPKNCVQQPDLNLLDRQWITSAMVRQIWEQLGGRIDGEDAQAATPAGATVLVSHLGRPLAEVARGMMKRSDNPMTRLLYLRLGAGVAQEGELTLNAAARAVRTWFEVKGIPTDGLVMDNGSGLSRSERISPQQMADVLAVAHRGPHAPDLIASLPLAGVDGTMARRLKGTLAQGRARLKSGTLRNVVAVAGYVPDQQNRTWVVVAMVNHDTAAAKARPVLDSVVEWVASQR